MGILISTLNVDEKTYAKKGHESEKINLHNLHAEYKPLKITYDQDNCKYRTSKTIENRTN